MEDYNFDYTGLPAHTVAELEALRRQYVNPPQQAPASIGYDDSEARFIYDARKRQEAFDKAMRQAMIKYGDQRYSYDERMKDWASYPGGKTLSGILLSPPEAPNAKTLRQLLPQ
jgi:hypothetical protein